MINSTASNSLTASKTFHYLWQIVRYKPLMFWGLVVCYVVQYCLSMVPVLIARQIIDGLTGHAQVGLNLDSLVWLWIVSELARASLFSTIIVVELLYLHQFWALVRANLFERILNLPGAQALPYSAGEALSRF